VLREQRALKEQQEAARQSRLDEANRRARLLGDRIFDEAGRGTRMPHPGPIASMVPVLGSAQEAIADAEDHDYLGAAGNAVLAASDGVLVKAIAGGVLKGGLKAAGPYVWRTKPREAHGMRKWLGAKGFLEKGEHGHHALIPQNGWGKAVPDFIKNQPWNIKGLDAVTHGRVHGPYKVDGVQLPRFDFARRAWYGTPDYAKALAARAAGAVHGATRPMPPGVVPPLLMD
jgi:hypothetical protein